MDTVKITKSMMVEPTHKMIRVSDNWITDGYWMVRKNRVTNPETFSSEDAARRLLGVSSFGELPEDNAVRFIPDLSKCRPIYVTPLRFEATISYRPATLVLYVQTPSDSDSTASGFVSFNVKCFSGELPRVLYQERPGGPAVAAEDPRDPDSIWFVVMPTTHETDLQDYGLTPATENAHDEAKVA